MKGHIQSQILKKTTKILAGKNIEVYTEGFAPRVEYNPVTKQPEAVFIPDVPDNAGDDLIGAMHGYIDHECGHILESSSEDICDSSKSKLWHFIHNCIEDPRINNRMADRYAGSEANIRAGYNYMFNRIDPATEKNAYSKEFVDEIDLTDEEAVKDAQVNYSSVWFAKKANCRFHGPKFDELELDRLFDPLEAKMDSRYLDALRRCKTTEEVKLASDYFVDFFHKEFDDSGGGGGSSGSETGKTGDPKKAGSDPKSGRLADPSKLEDELSKAIAEDIEHLAKKGKKNWYFSDRFDTLHTKYTINEGKELDIFDFETETKTVTNYLAKDLRRLLESRNRRWYVGGYRSGKLNQKVLHSVRTGNDRIFAKKSEVRAVRASVGLLVDMSGSMSGPHARSDGKDTKVYLAMQAAYAFALVLEQLKVPYEVWGFTTAFTDKDKQEAWKELEKTIDPVVAAKVISPITTDIRYAFKRFEENLDLTSKRAMVAAAQKRCTMLNNEDSVHVRDALLRLAERPEEQKSLFVFSDGQPAYSPGNIKNTMEMLKYLDKNSKSLYGVEMFGIGIMSDSVTNYYSNNKVVKQLSELPEALFSFLRTRI